MNSPDPEHWFIAVLVFESSIQGDKNAPHIEEYIPKVDLQFRLVRASDSEAAYARALAIGEREEHSYENPYGETCAWSFMGLKDLQEMVGDELGDGVEVYGFITEGQAKDHVVPKGTLTG